MTKRAVSILAAALALVPIWLNPLVAEPPPAGGSISIEPRTADVDHSPSTQAFVNAAGEALAARGFTILEDSGHAAYVAELILTRVEVGTGLAKPPTGGAAVTPGGAFGSTGAGVSIPLSTGRSELVPLQRTQIELRIRKRGEVEAVWHGSAMTVRSAGTRKGADEVVALDLSEAIGTVRYSVRGAGCRHQITNLSPKITANWLLASPHSRGGRFHSSAA